jgi:integrase
LRLVVAKAGARKWVLRYQINGRRREMGLGTFPAVSLKDARCRADDARKLASKGIDPIDHRNTVEAPAPTFTEAAAAHIRMHRRGWSNPKHARQWAATLKTYARPVIGAKPVDEIGTEDVLRILQPIWHRKTETAKRVQGRIENILDFAAARKWRDPGNPARWRGHLDKLLASPNKVKAQRNGGTARNQPALPYTDVSAFMVELRRLDSVSARALEFLILTATRTSEVLQAQWSEIDLDAAVWTVPAARMKARKEHRVPLAPAALDVLSSLPRIEGNPYVFPGARHGRPLSNMALLQVMRGMGYGVGGDRGDAVPHGFRSSFRDWAGEVSSFPHDVCEMALAHTIGNKAEKAYRRGDLFAKRRGMMEQWAAWCEKPATTIAYLAEEADACR